MRHNVPFSLPCRRDLALIESADELLRRDPRPPILYLRSFDDEAKQMTLVRALIQSFFGRLVGGGEAPYWFEQRDFGAYLSWVGPYIALARPGEGRVSGAARKTVPASKWKTVVRGFLGRAGFIVLRTATSPGLRWEIEQIVERFAPTRLLVITPGWSGDYQAFRKWAAPLLPKALPRRLPRSRLLAFDQAWTPYPLKPGADLVETISPFFRQHGIDFPRTSFEAYVREKRTGRPLRL